MRLTVFRIITAALLSLVELLIGLRVFLKLFGANSGTPFAHWLFETTQPLLAPFHGLFPAPALDGAYVLEFSALFAMFVYALFGYLILELMTAIDYYALRRAPRRRG